MNFGLALVMAVTVEALVEIIKDIVDAAIKKDWSGLSSKTIALAISVFLCLATGADIYGALGVTFAYPWLGTVLTGIFTSRGANYVSDLIGKLQNAHGKTE